MCGRYVLIDGKILFMVSAQIQTLKDQGRDFDILPKYDARPTNLMPVVAQRDSKNHVMLMRWGLVPHWSKDGKTEFTTFNARSETLRTSKLYAPYYKAARCLVPASGFFEWKKYTIETTVKGKPKTVEQKQKMYISMKNGDPFMMAGLFSVWRKPDGEEFPTYTIITTMPNEVTKEIHDRMPVILDKQHYDVWLDRGMNDTDFLTTLFVPYPAEKMTAFPVLNKSEDSSAMIERIEFEVPSVPEVAKVTKKLVR